MRRLALGLFAVAVAASAAWAQALCGYRSSETDVRDARMAFAYRYYDDPVTPAIDANSGRLSASYHQLRDGPNAGSSSAAGIEIALTGFVPSSWSAQASTSYRLYPWRRANAFLFGGLEALASSHVQRPGLEARAGFGLGRFHDVTPLAKALAIGERLHASGAIQEGLTRDTVLALAEMIGRTDEYATPGDLLADIEALVEFDAGAQLDVWSLREIEDLALQRGKERVCGWAVQAGVGYELLDPYGGSQDVVFAVSGDAAYAGSPRDQFLFHLSFSGPAAILDENSLLGSASCVLDFAEGQAITAEYAISRVQPSEGTPVTTHAARLGLTFGLSRGSLGVQVSVSHTTGETGWAIDVSLAAAVELL